MAKTQKGSVELLKRIVYEDPMQWQEILDGILECILEVMTDEYGHHIFLMVLERCDLCQFQTIIDTLELDEDLLIHASFPKHGSIAVQGFIKKLKLTGLAHSITSLLSKRFVELMTSEHGRYVVLQCIYTFGAKENEVLFSCAMRHFKELATTEYGCSSLFDFLKLICGFQRKQLLQNIADESNFLVNDCWGWLLISLMTQDFPPGPTIVLKKVLTLNDNEAIHKICDRLKMEFINLSSRKGCDGCQVVLKCFGASEYGTKCVLESLLQGSEEALLKLASDRFGTFVIQTALFKARSFDIKLYKLLVAILKPHFLALSSNENGRLMMDFIISSHFNSLAAPASLHDRALAGFILNYWNRGFRERNLIGVIKEALLGEFEDGDME
nr:pumilio homolog 12-like [Ipomoea batatas]GME06305.1 pumilio homolog 12-like [Ipomoea batatas]